MENPERVKGERQEAKKDSQEQETVVRGQREKIQNGQTGDKRFEDEGGAGVQHQHRGVRLYSGGIRVRGGSHSVTSGDTVGGSSRNESC